MLHLHQVNGFSNSLWLIPVNSLRTTSGYRTKTAAAGTYISQYHKGGRAGTPALSHIRTVTTFTNSMKLMRVYQVANIFIALSYGKLYPQPVWLISLCLW